MAINQTQQQPRPYSFVVRLSEEEHAILIALTRSNGLTQSDVVRQAIRRWRNETDAMAPAYAGRKSQGLPEDS